MPDGTGRTGVRRTVPRLTRRLTTAPVAAMLAAAMVGAGVLGCGGEGASARTRAGAGVAESGARKTAVNDTTSSADAGGGGRTKTAAKCRPATRMRMVMVGTSLTAGLGLDPDQAYPALLQKKADSAGFDVEIVNAGVSGETSAGALERADWLLRAPLDVFYLETGANDGLRAFDPEATRRNVEAILGKARVAHPDAQLLLAQMEAPTNLGPRYTSAFHAVFPSAARSAGATLVPFLLDRVAGIATLNQGDGIHPTVAGERIVADNVWPSVARALETSRARRGALDPCVRKD